MTTIFGKINIEAEADGNIEEIEKTEFYIDNILKNTDYDAPYIWQWREPAFLSHTIKIVMYYNTGSNISSEVTVLKFF